MRVDNQFIKAGLVLALASSGMAACSGQYATLTKDCACGEGAASTASCPAPASTPSAAEPAAEPTVAAGAEAISPYLVLNEVTTFRVTGTVCSEQNPHIGVQNFVLNGRPPISRLPEDGTPVATGPGVQHRPEGSPNSLSVSSDLCPRLDEIVTGGNATSSRASRETREVIDGTIIRDRMEDALAALYMTGTDGSASDPLRVEAVEVQEVAVESMRRLDQDQFGPEHGIVRARRLYRGEQTMRIHTIRIDHLSDCGDASPQVFYRNASGVVVRSPVSAALCAQMAETLPAAVAARQTDVYFRDDHPISAATPILGFRLFGQSRIVVDR